MGKCCSRSGVDDSIDNQINEKLKRDRKKSRYEVKLLLLGAGQSGKSTVLKQMKMIHGDGFLDEERDSYRKIIFLNIMKSIQALVQATDTLGIEVDNIHNKKLCDLVSNHCSAIESTVFPKDLSDAIDTLWKDKGIQAAYARSNEFQLDDSASYLFEELGRITAKNYKPSDQDILRARAKTTGVIEVLFNIEDLVYKMYDVGGQRSERKKWTRCFENVTSIIFIVAISEYDQVLIEDKTVNRMQEALTLFSSICNSKWFVKTSIILFLNKIDLFKAKVKKVPIGDYFTDYNGPNEYEDGYRYFVSKFVALSRSKKIYSHATCATDTNQIKIVMNAVNTTMRENILDSVNIL